MAYNFRVTIDERTMGFAEVAGLQREHKTETYRHGLSFLEGEEIVKFRYDSYQSITLKKGVAGGDYLYKWLEDKKPRSIDIDLCDESGDAVLRWHIAKAVPVKLDAPTFDARAGEVAVESLEVQAAGVSVKTVTGS